MPTETKSPTTWAAELRASIDTRNPEMPGYARDPAAVLCEPLPEPQPKPLTLLIVYAASAVGMVAGAYLMGRAVLMLLAGWL